MRKKKLLFMEDLLQLFRENGLTKFSSSDSGYRLCVQVPATFEVEDEVDEAHALRVVPHWCDLQHIVVGTQHLVGPVGITHLQVVLNLLTCHLEGEKMVFETVEVEEIAHFHLASLDGGVEEERC